MAKRLTSLFSLTTFILAVSGSAFAADIAVKAPLPAPAPVYSWTGWYAGVNAGASFGHVTTDFNVAPVTVTTLAGPAITTPGVAGSDTEYPSGFMGGGQIGYNWQYSPLIVVGLEADFQGALERDSNIVTSNFTGVAAPLSVTGSSVPPIRKTNPDRDPAQRLARELCLDNHPHRPAATGGVVQDRADDAGG
jgi:outer membrane immunogenic protein